MKVGSAGVDPSEPDWLRQERWQCRRSGRPRRVMFVKFDWYLFIGSLCMLVFLVTRWTTESFLNGFGLGLGLVGLVVLGVSIGVKLTAKKNDS